MVMAEVKFSETKIQKNLLSHFNSHKYHLTNSYIYGWESDYFSITKSGYAYEIEVKTSISDFRADFKKLMKHDILRNAKGIVKEDENKNFKRKIPNRFFYCVPVGLISAENVPDYAGLIYDHGFWLEEIKKAPFLHKEKFDLTKVLLEKFYYKSVRLEYDAINVKF